MGKPFGVGIVGCGLIGQKRAKALGHGNQLVACADLDVERAESLARKNGAKVFRDWRELVWASAVDVVIVATLHDSLAEITRTAAEAGKHVLVEKPAARNAAELGPVMDAAAKNGVKVHVGFNHRYHRSLRQAKELVDSGALGELMFVRARYGHGGRICATRGAFRGWAN
jgi:predicted dehydrogenase